MSRLMKILFLNPQIDAEHKISKGLGAKGVALLFPADMNEALQMLKLHGTSIDLAIVHREDAKGQGEPGVEFIKKVKSDPSQSDLPIILTTGVWDDVSCAKHQNTSQGANGYLRTPFSENAAWEMIQAVLGSGDHLGAPVLEDLSQVFRSPEVSTTGTSIRFEAPQESGPPEAPSAELSIQLPSSDESIPPFAQPDSPVPEAAAPPSFSIQTDQPAYAEPSPPPSAEKEEFIDREAAAEMPYLFARNEERKDSSLIKKALALLFAEPVGDAVVPGGVAQAPDLETVKKYLLLREQDVGVLSTRLKSAEEQIAATELLLKEERAKNAELAHLANTNLEKVENFDTEKAGMVERFEREIKELEFQVKAKSDKIRVFERQTREATEEMEHLKERVRSDIRKIRVREKELENRLEILKKDSEALISARENKIIELKRKLDLVEFNMDLLQDQYVREKNQSGKIRERMVRAAQAVRVANGLLDLSRNGDVESSESPSETQSSESSDQQAS